jgi:hypothetical protein
VIFIIPPIIGIKKEKNQVLNARKSVDDRLPADEKFVISSCLHGCSANLKMMRK